jgi:CDP-glycerol glycerophosphotransferase
MKKEILIKLINDLFILPLFYIFDTLIPKNNYYWGFSVHHIKSNQFIENQRAIFEEIKKNKNIKKIIFTRNNDDNNFQIEGEKNTIIVKINSIKGFFLFSKCKVLFISHSISMDYSIRYNDKLFSIVKPNLKKRLIINLWHGIPLKRLLSLANTLVKERTDRINFHKKERKYYTGLITSSDIDSYAMATMFYPIKYKNIWLTGLPRNDLLIKKEKRLPEYIKTQINSINNIKMGKKLIVYAPTYRQTTAVINSSYYQFSPDEINKLRKILKKNNAILGFRMHYFRNDKNLFNIENFIDNKYIFNLGHEVFPEIAPIIRTSDLIITDYSSVYIDGLYINKPVIGFMYDKEHYSEQEDGFLYDLDIAFPGPITNNFDSLIKTINLEINSKKQIKSEKYLFAKKLFFNFFDDNNSERVIKRIIKLIKYN